MFPPHDAAASIRWTPSVEVSTDVPDSLGLRGKELILGRAPSSSSIFMTGRQWYTGRNDGLGRYYAFDLGTGSWTSEGPFTMGPPDDVYPVHTDFRCVVDSLDLAHVVFEALGYDDPEDTGDRMIGYKYQGDGASWSASADPFRVSYPDSVTPWGATSPKVFYDTTLDSLHVLWGQKVPPDTGVSIHHRAKSMESGLDADEGWGSITRIPEEATGPAFGFLVDSSHRLHIVGGKNAPDAMGGAEYWVLHTVLSEPTSGDTWVVEDIETLEHYVVVSVVPDGGTEADDVDVVVATGPQAGFSGGPYGHFAWRRYFQPDPAGHPEDVEQVVSFGTLDLGSLTWNPAPPDSGVVWPQVLSTLGDGMDSNNAVIAADGTGIHVLWNEKPEGQAHNADQVFHRFTTLPSPSTPADWTAIANVVPDDPTKSMWPTAVVENGVLYAAYTSRVEPFVDWYDPQHAFFREGHVVPDTADADMTLGHLVFLDGDFTIPDGITVTFAPGTIVSVAPGDRLASGLDTERTEIIVEDGGRLIAAGTPSQPIVIRSALPDSGLVDDSLYWGGIHLLTYASAQTGYGYVCCGGSTACEDEDGIPYVSLCDAEKTEFDHVEISGATYGISIDRNIAPEIRNTSFTNILGDRDIYLRNGDAVLPVDFTWELRAPTDVVANDTGSVPDSLEHAYGTDGKRDLVFEGSLITSSASPGAVVAFRSESRTTGTGDDWGGAVLLPSGAVRSIQDADFAYAANPLFVYYADSTLVLRRSSIHHFEDVGLWMKGDFGTGLVVGDSLTIYRGEGLDENRGRRGVYLDGADKLTFRGNSIALEENLEGKPTGVPFKAIEVYFGKTACMTQGGSSRMLSIDGNVLAGPGLHTDQSESGYVRGIYSDWVCGGSYRDVEYTNNLIEDFDLHGMEFSQSSDIQVSCNTVTDNWQSVEHRRDSEPTGAGVRFRSNVFSTPAGPKQMVRTDNALKTKLGGTGDKGNNRFWTNGLNQVYPRFLMEDEPGSTHVALDATKCGWFADSTRITNPTEIDTSTFVWSNLLDESLEGTGHPDEPKVNLTSPNTGFLNDCGGSARPGQWPRSAIAPTPEEAPTGTPITDVPTVTSIGPPFPNPSRGTITVDLAISADHAGHYRVRLYDVGGRLVGTMMDREVTAGRYRVDWSARSGARGNIAPGVYFVRTTGPGVERNSKLVVLR